MHDALTLFPMLFVILAGILLNRHDVKELGARLESRIDKLEARFDHRLDKLEADMNNFYAVTGRLDGRLDELSRNR